MSSYKLLGRYTKVFPVTLFRLQSSASVKLKEYYRQQKQNKPSFDFKIGKDGLVHPMTSDEFVIPNGISMRPIGQMLETILRPFHGKFFCMIKKGVVIPENLVLLHEHTDHYSLQTAVPCKEEELNKRLTQFLKENGTVLTKDELLKLISEEMKKSQQ